MDVSVHRTGSSSRKKEKSPDIVFHQRGVITFAHRRRDEADFQSRGNSRKPVAGRAFAGSIRLGPINPLIRICGECEPLSATTVCSNWFP